MNYEQKQIMKTHAEYEMCCEKKEKQEVQCLNNELVLQSKALWRSDCRSLTTLRSNQRTYRHDSVWQN